LSWPEAIPTSPTTKPPGPILLDTNPEPISSTAQLDAAPKSTAIADAGRTGTASNRMVVAAVAKSTPVLAITTPFGYVLLRRSTSPYDSTVCQENCTIILRILSLICQIRSLIFQTPLIGKYFTVNDLPPAQEAQRQRRCRPLSRAATPPEPRALAGQHVLRRSEMPPRAHCALRRGSTCPGENRPGQYRLQLTRLAWLQRRNTPA